MVVFVLKNEILITILYLQDLNFKCKMNKIKEVLERKGIKQKWLADNLGKSYNMVNAYVQNRQQPRLEVLKKIARILDVDITELLNKTK